MCYFRELLFQIKRRPAGNKKAQLSEAKTPEIDCELEEFEKSPYKMIKQDQPEVDMRTLNELRKKVVINWRQESSYGIYSPRTWQSTRRCRL